MTNYKFHPVVSSGYPDVLAEDLYEVIECASSSSINTYGSWVEIIADTGNGNRIIGVHLVSSVETDLGDAIMLEIATGIISSEVVVLRYCLVGSLIIIPLILPANRTIPANSRLSVRVKDGHNATSDYGVSCIIGVVS